MKKINFVKSQALGNDFIIIDNRNNNITINKETISRLLNRKYGIGADELLLWEKSKKADIFMRIFNLDGTEAEACGNGIRASAKLLFEELKTNEVKIETIPSIIECKKIGDLISVQMPEPQFSWDKIPLSKELDTTNIDLDILNLDKNIFKKCMFSNVGNPHCVLLLKDNSDKALENLDLNNLGANIETNPLFPQKINVEFIQILSANKIRARIWERGSGETFACGSGSCGITSACVHNRLTDKKVTVIMKGGQLEVSYNDNTLTMIGGAETVFEGKIEI